MSHFIRILGSEQLAKMLARVHQLETGQELADRLYASTQTGVGRILRVFLGTSFLASAYFYSFVLDPFYFDPGQPLFNRIFGILVCGCNLPCSVLIMGAYVVVSYLYTFVLTLSRVQLEAAYDELSPNVAQVGIRRFVTLPAASEPLNVTPEAMNRFQRAWNEGVRQHRHVEQVIVPGCRAVLLYALLGLCKPTVMLLLGMPVRATSWINIGYVPLGWWGPVASFHLLILKIARHRAHVQTIVNFGKELLCTNPTHGILLCELLRKHDLSFYFLQAPPYAVNWAMAHIVVLLMMASAVPFFFLEWTIAPWPLD